MYIPIRVWPAFKVGIMRRNIIDSRSAKRKWQTHAIIIVAVIYFIILLIMTDHIGYSSVFYHRTSTCVYYYFYYNIIIILLVYKVGTMYINSRWTKLKWQEHAIIIVVVLNIFYYFINYDGSVFYRRTSTCVYSYFYYNIFIILLF